MPETHGNSATQTSVTLRLPLIRPTVSASLAPWRAKSAAPSSWKPAFNAKATTSAKPTSPR